MWTVLISCSRPIWINLQNECKCPASPYGWGSHTANRMDWKVANMLESCPEPCASSLATQSKNSYRGRETIMDEKHNLRTVWWVVSRKEGQLWVDSEIWNIHLLVTLIIHDSPSSMPAFWQCLPLLSLIFWLFPSLIIQSPVVTDINHYSGHTTINCAL